MRDSEIHENRDIAGKLFYSGSVVHHDYVVWSRRHREHKFNLLSSSPVEIYEYRNGLYSSFADELCDEKMDLQHTEEGFRGTLLTSNVSSQVV